jgi:hypothetical protein
VKRCKITPPYTGVITVLILLGTYHQIDAQWVPSAKRLPVYEVIGPFTGDTTINILSNVFKLSKDRISVRNGVVSFVDEGKYLAIPSHPLVDTEALRILKSRSAREIQDAPTRYDAIDFEKLRQLPVPDSAPIPMLARQVFISAGLDLDSATAELGHNNLTVSYKEPNGILISLDKPLDTWVKYEFHDPNGIPFTGPGAHVQITFDPQLRISQLHYAWRKIKAGPMVRVISESEARSRIAELLPKGTKVNLKLTYWCPPFEDSSAGGGQITIIPWYSFTSVSEEKNSAGRPMQVVSREQLIPATDDTSYVPNVHLTAIGMDNGTVHATAEVSGGRRPYTYLWGGSNPAIRATNASMINYAPIVRAVSSNGTPLSPNQTVLIQESVSVLVIDANGATQESPTINSVKVMAHPVLVPPAPQVPTHSGAGSVLPSYGCESPAEPTKFIMERRGWQQGMANSGGGEETFCWLGNNSWPGDYIKPSQAGSMPASPWINGDADYSNWGVNTANLVFINGDGSADNFTAMYPNAPPYVYSYTNLFVPGNEIGTVELPVPAIHTYYHVNYAGSWGPIGTNDRLYWLAGLLCQCLDPTDGTQTAAERWGPAFGGLHIFTGFASDAKYTAGAFPKAFAENILGVYGPVQTITSAWFNASNSSNVGTAAAMGPITIGGVSDLNDYYIGKGSRGPTIAAADIAGWWYIH